MTNWLVLLTIIFSFNTFCDADLVVNVRNQGGESYKQTIKANLTDDTVQLNFDSYDGSSTLLVIDFRNEIQLLHTTRLGDQQELNLLQPPSSSSTSQSEQPLQDTNKKQQRRVASAMGSPPTLALYKSYCFVTKFRSTEFIPVDAMAKLRQKNPWSLRTPERIEPTQNISFDIMLDPTATDWISPVIRRHCSSSSADGFQIVTYAVKSEIGEKASNGLEYLRAVRDFGGSGGDCFNGSTSGSSSGNSESAVGTCSCTVSVCIGWYPCALKFCRARNNSSNSSMVPGGGGGNGVVGGGSSAAPDGFKTYRCGIHTCRICRNYIFGAASPFECV